MENRRLEADAKYRARFEELGLDELFDYIRYQDHDHFFVRCKKCGVSFSRSLDVFKGRQKRILCKKCGNGSILHSEFVNEVLEFYREGNSVAVTAKEFGITTHQLNGWVKLRGESNGKDFREGGVIANQIRHDTADPENKESDHYKRAKKRGLPAEKGITLEKLIDRDGDRCAICGLPCFFSDDYLAALYPTIDHIIPISRGGGHIWSNVQVAHRICNSHKGNKVGKEWHNVDC